MDWVLILTIVATGATVIASIYAFLRNFKTDINNHIDRLDEENKESRKQIQLTNMRLDGLYKVLLTKVYGKSEEI